MMQMQLTESEDAPKDPYDAFHACAESSEDAEGWVDGLLMAAHIAAGKQLQALKHALTVVTM